MIRFLKFNNHFIKTVKLLSRDVTIGHVYEKTYVDNSSTGDYLYMLSFIPNTDITVTEMTTIDTQSGTSSSNGLVVLDKDLKCFMASTKNNHCSNTEAITVADHTMYQHTWTFDSPMQLYAGTEYAIQVNYSKYQWSTTQYDFSGTIQDGIQAKATVYGIYAWLANNTNFRNAEIGSNYTWSFPNTFTLDMPFTTINGINILEL